MSGIIPPAAELILLFIQVSNMNAYASNNHCRFYRLEPNGCRIQKDLKCPILKQNGYDPARETVSHVLK